MRGILDKMISMLKIDPKPKDRESGCLIGRKLDRRKRESCKLEILGGTDYVAIGKKWMFDLFKFHYRQSEGDLIGYKDPYQ